MQQKTLSECVRNALSFYQSRGIEMPCIDTIEPALINAAYDYKKSYWNRIRYTISIERKTAGDFETAALIKDIKYPLDRHTAYKIKQEQDKKSRQKSSNGITNEQFKLLYHAAGIKEDLPLLSALYLARYLGCRLNEIEKVVCLVDGRIFIPGSKKTDDGQRGLDRYINANEEFLCDVKLCIYSISEMPVTNSSKSEILRQRLNTLVKRVLGKKRRKSQSLPTFKSLRHQLGSDFKQKLDLIEKFETDQHIKHFPDSTEARLVDVDRTKSRLFRLKIAYIMGHQSTESLDTYGDRRRSQSGGGNQSHLDYNNLEPSISMEEIAQLVREQHDVPYSERMKIVNPKHNSTEDTTQDSDFLNCLKGNGKDPELE